MCREGLHVQKACGRGIHRPCQHWKQAARRGLQASRMAAGEPRIDAASRSHQEPRQNGEHGRPNDCVHRAIAQDMTDGTSPAGATVWPRVHRLQADIGFYGENRGDSTSAKT